MGKTQTALAILFFAFSVRAAEVEFTYLARDPGSSRGLELVKEPATPGRDGLLSPQSSVIPGHRILPFSRGNALFWLSNIRTRAWGLSRFPTTGISRRTTGPLNPIRPIHPRPPRSGTHGSIQANPGGPFSGWTDRPSATGRPEAPISGSRSARTDSIETCHQPGRRGMGPGRKRDSRCHSIPSQPGPPDPARSLGRRRRSDTGRTSGGSRAHARVLPARLSSRIQGG